VTAAILVTGGTGTLGRLVVSRLRAAGCAVRVLSRHDREDTDGIKYVTCDLLRDDGVEAAIGGAETILHLAGAPKGDDRATQHLVRAASQSRVMHLVYVSVIGADRVPIGYFRSKFAAEQAVADSGLPFTTLRAAQFHDLILTVAQKMARMPLIPMPTVVRFQPVDADEVAARLVGLALGEPGGLVPDLPGPKIYPMRDLVRGYLEACGKHRLMMPIPLPGKTGRAYRAGENLSLERAAGHRTWEDFLAERLAPGTTPET
jgi:uncharacterized protein YbjT (DUF2867 family)